MICSHCDTWWTYCPSCGQKTYCPNCEKCSVECKGGLDDLTESEQWLISISHLPERVLEPPIENLTQQDKEKSHGKSNSS